MSGQGGHKVYDLSEDHKPTEENEMDRILNNGGRIYQNASVQQSNQHVDRPSVVLGPHRVFPGRLSVSRTFGDIEAKHPACSGNDKVVICDPDIVSFKVQPD